jgi:Metallopeptidase family M81
MLQEANTFSPVMTRYGDFTPVFGQAALDRHRGKMIEMGGFIEILTKTDLTERPLEQRRTSGGKAPKSGRVRSRPVAPK